MTGWLLGALTLILGFWMVGAYNRLVRLRQAVQAAFQTLEPPLRERHEALIVLAGVMRPVMAGRSDGAGVVEAVLAATRQTDAALEAAHPRPVDAALMSGLVRAERVLRRTLEAEGPALQAAMAVPEGQAATQPPEPLALAREAWQRVEAAQAQTAFAARQFNEAVALHNEAVDQVPTRAVARLFRFGPAAAFDLAEGVN
jgi:LemA protein